MPTPHEKVPATLTNCEKDHEAKLKLDEEFDDFEKLVLREAKKSREVSELIGPLERLKKFSQRAAYGRHLVPVPPPKGKKKVSTARATRRAGRK
jgi:hypothetical protein